MVDIVDFTRKQQFKIGEKKVSDYQCAHSELTIDEKRRLIVCDNCGQHFDAFDYVMKIAEKEIRIRSNLRYLRGKTKQLSEEIEDKKRELRNIKAQVNRANKRSTQKEK
ncbi:hypothetical protein AAFX60_019005 [Aliivibrio fischeri]